MDTDNRISFTKTAKYYKTFKQSQLGELKPIECEVCGDTTPQALDGSCAICGTLGGIIPKEHVEISHTIDASAKGRYAPVSTIYDR